MTKDYGHKVRFSPEHHILLKYGKNLLKYPESVKKIGNGKLNLLGTLLVIGLQSVLLTVPSLPGLFEIITAELHPTVYNDHNLINREASNDKN